MDAKECCGWPELGVCADCPDAATVAWGMKNPPKRVPIADLASVIVIAGSSEAFAMIRTAVETELARREAATSTDPGRSVTGGVSLRRRT